MTQLPIFLTPRQAEVYRLIVLGWCNKQVASELCISLKTAEKHRGILRDKLGVTTPVELLHKGLRVGLITFNDWSSTMDAQQANKKRGR